MSPAHLLLSGLSRAWGGAEGNSQQGFQPSHLPSFMPSPPPEPSSTSPHPLIRSISSRAPPTPTLMLPCAGSALGTLSSRSDVLHMPQYRLLLARGGKVELTLQQSGVPVQLSVTTLGGGFRAEHVLGVRKHGESPHFGGTEPGSDMMPSSALSRTMSCKLDAHVEYAVVLQSQKRGSFHLTLAAPAGSAALLQAPFEQLPRLTIAQGHADRARKAADLEAARRSAALSAMQDAAAASPVPP